MLRCPSPRRRVRCARFFTGLVLFAGISAESAAAEDLQSAVADARAAADAGNYVEAFSKGIAALEAYPESRWDPPTLRRLIVQVSDRWFPRLSREQKQTAIGLLGDPKSPGAKWAKAYGLWKLKQRVGAIALLMPLIREHPNSAGAEHAIRGLLLGQQSVLGDLATTSTVKTLAETAPNNAGTAWAMCHVAWRFGSKGRFSQLKRLYTDMDALTPDGSVAGRAAADLRSMLEAIETGDYAQAFNLLSALREYMRTGTPAGTVVDTFLHGIDWKHPDASAGKIAALQQYFGQAAETDPDGERRSFAIVILARILQKQGKNTKAADQYQRIVDSGVELMESYALSKIGYLVHHSDPERAIAAFEKLRQVEGPASVAMREEASILLGILYVKKYDYSKAEELFTWLLEQERAGEFLFDNLDEQVAAYLTAALFGQGKDDQAHEVIDPYLAKYGYGEPKENLTEDQLIRLEALLQMMGKPDEAEAYGREFQRRRR